MSAEFEQNPWPELPIVCPHCGNHGEPEGEWQANAWTPFKLIEEVVRSWEFDALQDGSVLRLTADASSDATDWESGANLASSACNVSDHSPS
jgi:hypothetical protein